MLTFLRPFCKSFWFMNTLMLRPNDVYEVIKKNEVSG